jgi:predicted MFS family arabinose efflux permease
LITLLGIGASLSNLIAEQIVQLISYDAGFLFLGGVAVIGLLVFVFWMPETAPHKTKAPFEEVFEE